MFGFGKDLKEYNLSAEELTQFQYAKITTENGTIWIKLFQNQRHKLFQTLQHWQKMAFIMD